MNAPRFDARWQSRRRWQARWQSVRVWILFAAVLAGGWLLSQIALPQPDPTALPRHFTLCGQKGSTACVIDGDTVSLGPFSQRRRIRLTGFDAPELEGACLAEREAALRARGFLLKWLNAEPAFVDGGNAPPYDRYGRELRAASRADGSLLADAMLEADLAEGSGWGAFPVDWCA